MYIFLSYKKNTLGYIYIIPVLVYIGMYDIGRVLNNANIHNIRKVVYTFSCRTRIETSLIIILILKEKGEKHPAYLATFTIKLFVYWKLC